MNPLLTLVSSRHLATTIACLGASIGLAVTSVFLQGSAAAERVRVVSAKVAPRGELAQQLVESADATPGQTSHESLLFRHGTYPAAWTAAQKSNRPILVYVSMPNCPHCVKMMENTYERSEVSRLVTTSFETICIDRFRHAKLVQSLQVKLYPTTVLVGPDNKVLDVIEGYVDAKTFQRRLQSGLASSRPATTKIDIRH